MLIQSPAHSPVNEGGRRVGEGGKHFPALGLTIQASHNRGDLAALPNHILNYSGNEGRP